MMLRMLFFFSICLLIYIPHTSIQDVSTSNIEDQSHHLSRRAIKTDNIIYDIEYLIQWLTEKQYQYEIAYYTLALNNIFQNFAQFFHERSEQKYDDIKGLIRLCQVLNIDINLQYIASSIVNRPLRLLSPDRINKTNFAQFFSDLKKNECETTFIKLSNIYRQTINVSIPLQMYFEGKIYPKQILTCKITSDLYTQLDRFIQANPNDRSIPFSLMFFDSRAKIMLSK